MTKRQRDDHIEGFESIDLANCLMLLSHPYNYKPLKTTTTGSVEFECKTCNRKFPSFQALGGHRTSHKRPKLEAEEEQRKAQQAQSNRPKMHECSICGQGFSVGQALGGHMRKHRAEFSEAEGFSSSVKRVPAVLMKRSNSLRVRCLDLNLTPLENDLKVLFGNTTPKFHAFV